MPLRKLWNALRGRTAADETPLQAVTIPSASTTKEIGATPKEKVQPAPAAKPPVVAVKPPVVAAKPARNILGFGGRSPHDPLCRAIAKSGAKSVLEISVGDGTRAIAVVETLSKAVPAETIRYAAIDQFEMVGSKVSLMDFHRHLRKHSIRAQIFPLEVKAGVTRVACTIGAVDLVLLTQEALTSASLTEGQWKTLLQRVTHQDSRVLRQEGDSWTQLEVTGATHVATRRAA